MEQQGRTTTTVSDGVGVTNKRRRNKMFGVNSALLALGVVMSLSGLMIQYYYHLLKLPAASTLFALNRVEWNAVHVWVSIWFLWAVLYHVWAHRRWYVGVLKSSRFSKHKSTLALTLLAVITVVSGVMPWLMGLFGGSSTGRFLMIEVHDKAALLFLSLLFLHTARRLKWYFNVIKERF